MPIYGPVAPNYLNVIHVASPQSLGDILIPVAASSASAVWPSANRAIFCPFEVPFPLTIKTISWINGTAVSGNVDVGIYDTAGNRLVSAGSTAQSGTSTVQQVAVSLAVAPGRFYMAMALDNGTGTTFRYAPLFWLAQTTGVQQMAAAFPLPTTATFANPASPNAYIPVMGVGVTTTL